MTKVAEVIKHSFWLCQKWANLEKKREYCKRERKKVKQANIKAATESSGKAVTSN